MTCHCINKLNSNLVKAPVLVPLATSHALLQERAAFARATINSNRARSRPVVVCTAQHRPVVDLLQLHVKGTGSMGIGNGACTEAEGA